MTPSPYDPPTTAPPPVATKDNSVLALVLTIVGVCCFPLSIVGGVLAWMAISAAKREGRPTPVAAIVALVFLGLSLLVAVGAVIAGVVAQADKAARTKVVQEKLKGKLDGAALDETVACDLATAYLVNDFYESAECLGTFTPGAIAKLEDVKAKKDANSGSTLHTFCFARAHRWFVISKPADGVCPPSAPPMPNGIAKDDDAMDEEEKALREAEATRGARELVDRYVTQLTDTRTLIDGTEHEERACPAWKEEVKASYVDYDALPGDTHAEQNWKLLTDSNLRGALDTSASMTARASSIEAAQIKSSYLAVFHAEDAKQLPVAHGNSFDSGEFDGWITVVDLKKNQVVCDTHLLFESSNSVGGGVRLKFVPKKSTASQVEDDFEDRFKDAAKAAANKMSNNQLRLGVGFLDQ